MDNKADDVPRRIYPEWLAILDDVHLRMRDTVLRMAWAEHDAAIETLGPERARERVAIGFGSALSTLTSASLLPFHLLTQDEEFDEAESILVEEGEDAVRDFLESRFPAMAEPLLLIGDQGVPSVIMEALDEQFEEERSAIIVVGPGPNLEPVVREWARQNSIPQGFVKSLNDKKGAFWRKTVSGLRSDDPNFKSSVDYLVPQLFDVFKPTRALILEPIVDVSTRRAMQEAQSRKLKLWRSRRVTPSLYMEKQREEKLESKSAGTRSGRLPF